MFIVNTETIPGYSISRILGLVQGNTIRAKHVGRDIGAVFVLNVRFTTSQIGRMVVEVFSPAPGSPARNSA